MELISVCTLLPVPEALSRGLSSVLFCYLDPEVPLWNWLFVTSCVYVLFCSVLFMLMDVSRKLNHDL